MNKYLLLLSLIGSGFIGFGIAFLLKGKILSKKISASEKEASQIIEHANIKAANLLKETELEAKDRLLKLKNDFDKETKETGAELKKQERRLVQKEEKLDKKIEQLEEKSLSLVRMETAFKNKEKALEEKKKNISTIVEEQKKKLETIANMSAQEAKKFLLDTMENEAKHESIKLIKKIEIEAKDAADKKAKDIIATAIQRYAGDYVSERTVSVVGLPNDEMKGRIIGREGRNIRALEAATGIDLIIDDTPEAVVLSGFNPIKREIARLSLEALIADGRIHPGRIEEIVKKAEKDLNEIIKEAGEQAVFDIGIHGIHKELIRHLGKLKFRTSYAQNVLQHSIEVGFLSGVIASELGLNAKLAKRMGLLHDIGKSIDSELEGSHAFLGAKLAKKCGEKTIVTNAIAAHHEEIPVSSVYDWIVQAADSISGARPGARKELIENYIKRLEDLESIANSFEGIANSYAVQAGRELRVIIESKKKSDDDAFLLSKEIAKKIEETMTFPGQIKVIVVRETRAVEYANKQKNKIFSTINFGDNLMNTLEILRKRGFIEKQTHNKELEDYINEGAATCYIGFDPTASSLHVGSLVPIMALAHIQLNGHRPIALVGGGTGLIGDPSGKTETRKLLTRDEIKENSLALKEQLSKFLDFEDGKALLLNNETWLADLKYINFLRDIGRHFSVNRMIKAESYKSRIESEEGLNFIEFNYMLLQSYDFLKLFESYDCRLQMGGSDQWGNIVAGIELVRKIHQKTTFGITFPLLITSTGKKMGKTERGTVWLDPNMTSPYEYYQFWVNTDDRDIKKFIALFTFLPIEEIEILNDDCLDAELNDAKAILAYEATKIAHGKEEADKAFFAAASIFGERIILSSFFPSSGIPRKIKETDNSLPTSSIDSQKIQKGIPAFKLFNITGLAASGSQAKRLIKQGGAYLNGNRIDDDEYIVQMNDFEDDVILLRAGKKRYHKIIINYHHPHQNPNLSFLSQSF